MTATPFDFWDKNAYLEYQEDDVRIYHMEGEQYLFVGLVMYASTTERSWYIHNVMPFAEGRCLELGLGLGVASKCILSKKYVSHLLTIENNPRVIEAFGRPFLKHNILYADVNKWVDGLFIPGPIYDFIFVDHYTLEDDEIIEPLAKLVEKLKPILKPEGKLILWVDENAPEEDKERIRSLWIT